MGKMTSRLMVVALPLLPTGALTQTGPAPDRGSRDPRVAEVRLLRQAVERLAGIAVRSQVLARRLAAPTPESPRAAIV